MIQQETSGEQYWKEVAGGGLAKLSSPLWRRFCDQLYLRLMNAWIDDRRFRATLKTDLFDEVVGDGLVEWMLSVSDHAEGIDIVPEIAKKAADRHPELVTHQADVRCLGIYPMHCFDLVVSNSTLDHFADESDLRRSLEELARVLAPGGLLFITLDNPQNPIISIRNRWSSTSPRRNRLMPYFMGHTLTQLELSRMVEAIGLTVERKDYSMHLPRVLFLHMSVLFSADSWFGKTILKLMHCFEVLNVLPTRAWTGHYSAVLARKPL